MSASNNPAICFLATRAALSAVGVLGHNRVYLANKYQCGRLSKGLMVPPWCRASSDEAPRVEQIRELVRARDGLAPIDIFEPEDITLVLEFITHRENSPITQTSPEPTLLSWGGGPLEKNSPHPWPHGKPGLITLIGPLRPYCSQSPLILLRCVTEIKFAQNLRWHGN